MFPSNESAQPPQNWFDAFHKLSLALEQQPAGKKVLFFDELPWLDTQQSGFVAALEYFWNAWSGYAFEYLCRYHIQNIKKALGISGVYTKISAWRSQKSEKGVQIDLVIDRKDHVINICEMKFSAEPYAITKAYSENLQHKLWTFKEETATKKTLFLTLITAHGLKTNEYSTRLVHDALDLDVLFT